jgi:hypothetical protein
MACEIIRIEDDLIFARVAGAMRLAEEKTLQNMAGQVIARGGKVRLLGIFEGFQG